MQFAEVIRCCRQIVEEAGLTDEQNLGPSNFLDYSNLVRDVVNDWPKEKKEAAWVQPFALGLRKLRDDFLKIVEADPPVLYKPLHNASLEFHQSPSRIRYYRAGNRSSKTQSAVLDDYWVLTGQHPWRARPPLPSSVGIIMVDFSKSGQTIFIPKFIQGEPSNPLSPIFPEGGKWLHHWDERKMIAVIACPSCAEAGKGQRCRHSKSKLFFFTAQNDPKSMAGGQHAQIHFSEQIPEKFFQEAQQRIKTVVNSGIIVEETPLGGKGFWTHKMLTVVANSGKIHEGTGHPLVSLHTVSQYETGLYPKEDIDAEASLMTVQERESRIYGRPAAYSKTAVFDNAQISDMIEAAKPPLYRCQLRIKHLYPDRASETDEWEEEADGYNAEDLLSMAVDDTVIEPVMKEDGGLRVWVPPEKHGQYVIGADVAEGLTTNDASCAQVLKMSRRGNAMYLTHVASYHDWINSIPYALVLYKLSLWYNCATIIPERRGPGDATCQSLRELGCWTLYRDTNDPASAIAGMDARFGVDTNIKTKPLYISTLQNLVWNRRTNRRNFVSWDVDTLDEMGSYGQERTDSGMTVRFRGEGGMMDDRVMGLAVGSYIAITGYIYDMGIEGEERRDKASETLGQSQKDKDMWDILRREEEARGALNMEAENYD